MKPIGDEIRQTNRKSNQSAINQTNEINFIAANED